MKIAKKSLALTLAVMMFVALIPLSIAVAAKRSSNTVDDTAPQIESSGKAIWTAPGGSDGGTDDEIFLFNGTSVVQLTTNTLDEQSPVISSSSGTVKAAWIANDGADEEIYFYNGTAVSQLTSNAGDEDAPQISGNRVVFVSDSSGNDDIWSSTDGAAATNLSSANATADSDPAVAGNNTVWVNNDDIYLHNGTSASALTSNASTTDESSPVVDSSGNAAWLSDPDNTDTLSNTEVVYKSSAGSAVQVTTNSNTESDLGIDSGDLVWTASDGTMGDNEIFYNSTGTAAGTKKITNNGVDDDNPVISSGRIAWEGFRRGANASTADENDGDYDIFIYTASDATTYQVNNDNADQYSADLNGTAVAYLGYDGTDADVYTDTIRSTSLSLKATPSKIKKGKATKLVGTLKNSAGAKLGGRKILIKAGSKTVATVYTNGKGSFSKKLKPSRTTTYKATYAGNGLALKKTSKGKKVTVKR